MGLGAGGGSRAQQGKPRGSGQKGAAKDFQPTGARAQAAPALVVPHARRAEVFPIPTLTGALTTIESEALTIVHSEGDTP